MRKTSVVLLLITSTVLLLFFVHPRMLEDNIDFISFEIDQFGNRERVEVWHESDNTLFVFLPGYAKLENVMMVAEESAAVTVGGFQIRQGDNCGSFEFDVRYELTCDSNGVKREYQLLFLKSSSIPALYIDTESGSLDHIHLNKSNQESGSIRAYTAEGCLLFSGNMQSLRGRGNSTWSDFEKKPYSIMLEIAADLFGLGKAQEWILLANAFDPTNLRNKIALEFSEELGLRYTPGSQWVDLYLNGEYSGLYLICERNEVNSERVAIADDGSFLVSVEREERLIQAKRQYIVTDANQALRIHYCDENVNVTEIMQSVENALLAEDGIDDSTQKKWDELIDVDSWVRKYLVEEILANTDGCAISQFFFYDGSDENQKVYAGPVWDYDASMGANVWWQINDARIFYANRPMVREGEMIPWFFSLYQKEEFYSQLVRIYEEECFPLIKDYIDRKVMDYKDQIKNSAEMDCIRWKQNLLFEEAVLEMLSFMSDRVEFLSELWLNSDDYHLVSVYPGYELHNMYYPIMEGDTLTELPQVANTATRTFAGWYYADTNTPYDASKPIVDDIEIYAKWEDTMEKKVDRLIMVIPLFAIVMITVGVLCSDLRRMRKGG